MALIGGGLGVLILLAWLFDWAWKETVREIRDIWHEDDDDEDEGEERPRRHVRRR
jgi:hypothetical protein